MAVLHKALVLLSLLFVPAFARRTLPTNLFNDYNDLGSGSGSNNNGGISIGRLVSNGFGNDSDNSDSNKEDDFGSKKKKEKRGDDFDNTEGDNNLGRQFFVPGDNNVGDNNNNIDNGSGDPDKIYPAKPDIETNYLGEFKLHSNNAGIAAMQFQLMPNGKAIWYDATDLGPSELQFPPRKCPINFVTNRPDCFAHGIEYDVETGAVRPLKMTFNPWCSSGGLAANGDLISTGGFNGGIRAVRLYTPCPNCEFREKQVALSVDRWYATTTKLEDGNFVVLGGRRSHNYEIIPPSKLEFPNVPHGLEFLLETEDPAENNLYPFCYLTPDGNLFVFANDRAIIIKPSTGDIIHRLPALPGGSRNYPASGMSALLPLELGDRSADDNVVAEVIVCGGNTNDAFTKAETQPKTFLPALTDCGRIDIMDPIAQWKIEQMPSPRVMGDMLILPNGQLLLINGAKAGSSGWLDADDPNFVPAIYNPKKDVGQRFKELEPATIPRMYHSVSAVIPDGNILIAGSNPNPRYDWVQTKFRTELRVEKFSPPYMDPALAKHKATIYEDQSDKLLKYGQEFNIAIDLEDKNLGPLDITLTLLSPPFTTHGYSQNQRMLVLKPTQVSPSQITAVAPLSGKIAPPGYYILFVVHRTLPSKGMWVQIGE